MDLTVYTQTYRCKTADRQREIDECLRRNLNHPGIAKVVLFKEADAPPLPQASVPVEVVESDERITYAEWLRWVKRQGSGIGLLLNADIYLDEGLEHLAATFDTPEAFLALTRYNPGRAGFHLNDYPHWTQDVWGVRADAELPESLLYASGFPLGFPGCDNRIAYVMWSHGFRVRNPCYHVRSVHLQASTARGYDKTGDRLYGGVSYVHPSLTPDEDAELEFTLWTRSEQRPAGVLVNQQAIEQGVHQLRHGEAEVAQRFLDLQQFTGLSWVHEAVGSAHLEGDLHPFASEDTVFLPMPALTSEGVKLQLPQPTQLEGLSIRLPRRAPTGYRLELQTHGDQQTSMELRGDKGLDLKPGGERRFWQPPELKAQPWQHLRLQVVGPGVNPAWHGEEGAELVLFGSTGSLEQAKSLNVIAENPPPSQNGSAVAHTRSRTLRSVRFADAAHLDARNLKAEPSSTAAADGSESCDVVMAASSESLVKYAFNTYNTSTPGTYTATLVLKPERQARIVLRINDQTGVNDARQAFDLQAGVKLGAAENGGSATGAQSSIQALGDGWLKCSITATFHEPVSCLHAPSLWFEHYAPSGSTDRLFTSQAEILEGEGQAAEDVLQQSPPQTGKHPAEHEPPTPTAKAGHYTGRRRSECTALLGQGEELHLYGSRFRVLRCGDELVFDDRFWPSVGVSPVAELPCELNDRRGLFLWGFAQPTLELRPGFIANTKRFSADVNFWQYPCRTEGDAFAVHQSLVGPQVRDGVLQLYLGLPWATWIDRQTWPTSTLKATAERLRKLRQELGELGLGLKVHSVCQHILWRDNLHLIKAAGVECLWLSHKPIEEDELENIELRSWHLYAVNIMEPNRRKGLLVKSPENKRYLASFIGAHMEHYITDVRPKLLRFKNAKDWLISLNNEWHFNKVVYGEQVENNFVLETWDTTQPKTDEDVIRYNQVLSESIFSLCPAGAGPNSLRLWESLAMGSIPVILSDKLVMPEIPCSIEDQALQNWEGIVIFHSEQDLDGLESRLRDISLEEIKQRSDSCIAISKVMQRKTCSMALAEEKKEYSAKPTIANQIPLDKSDSGFGNEKAILRNFKQQQIHEIGGNKSNFTGVTSIQPFNLTLYPDQLESQKVLHFDRAELVTAIEIISSSTTQFHAVIENSTGFNKYIQVANGIFPRHEPNSDKSCLLDLPGNGQWSESLKIKVYTLDGSIANEEINIKIGIETINNALAREMGGLNTKGSLYRCSAASVGRHDSLFLTTNIDSARVIASIKELDKDIAASSSAKVLFPAYPKQPCNLIGEEIADGISMYIHLMNRNGNIERNLANWLTLSFDELILLDWSTDGGITHLPSLFDDPRVRVVRVENQTRFIRTLAQNLASRIARNRKIFKCDSDVEFKGDFFQAHPLEQGEFWVGEWKQARDHNERHLHGETYYWLEDFLKVGGYDERIKSYGHDDSNFKDRLLLAGLSKKVFDYNFMHHQEHDQKERAQGSHGLHPMVATYANRLMTTYTPLWSPTSDLAEFRLLERSTDGKIIKFELVHQASEQTNSSHIDEAMRIVGSWYLKPEEISNMTNDEINTIIWEKQIE